MFSPTEAIQPGLVLDAHRNEYVTPKQLEQRERASHTAFVATLDLKITSATAAKKAIEAEAREKHALAKALQHEIATSDLADLGRVQELTAKLNHALRLRDLLKGDAFGQAELAAMAREQKSSALAAFDQKYPKRTLIRQSDG
jgi:hypothetical protein